MFAAHILLVEVSLQLFLFYPMVFSVIFAMLPVTNIYYEQA